MAEELYLTVPPPPERVKASAKQALFSAIRLTHKVLLRQPLPVKVALYFHELEERHWGAFRTAVEYFLNEGYSFVSAQQFVDDNIAGKSLFISFDDNYQSWWRARGLFRQLGLRATFYVNTLPFRDVCRAGAIAAYYDRLAFHGDRTPLSLSELVQLQDDGHAIACHSHSHFVLADLPRMAWDEEIGASKTQLEALLGVPVMDFSYPYGMRRYFSEGLRSYCAGIGFKTVAAAIPGMQRQAAADPLNIHRSRWNLDQSLDHNLTDLTIDGRMFTTLTGRSATG